MPSAVAGEVGVPSTRAAGTSTPSSSAATTASAKLQLPQTETDNHLSFSLKWADKKVASYRASFSYGKDQAVRAEIPAIFAAALGAPTGGKKNDKDEWTYNFAGPNGTKVELRDLGKMWSLGVEK